MAAGSLVIRRADEDSGDSHRPGLFCDATPYKLCRVHERVDALSVARDHQEVRSLIEGLLLPPLVEVGLRRQWELEELHFVCAGNDSDGVVAGGIRLRVRDLAERAARHGRIDELDVNPRQRMTLSVIHVTADEEPRSKMRVDPRDVGCHRDWVGKLKAPLVVPPLTEVPRSGRRALAIDRERDLHAPTGQHAYPVVTLAVRPRAADERAARDRCIQSVDVSVRDRDRAGAVGDSAAYDDTAREARVDSRPINGCVDDVRDTEVGLVVPPLCGVGRARSDAEEDPYRAARRDDEEIIALLIGP